jgi:hypothetical protein
VCAEPSHTSSADAMFTSLLRGRLAAATTSGALRASRLSRPSGSSDHLPLSAQGYSSAGTLCSAVCVTTAASHRLPFGRSFFVGKARRGRGSLCGTDGDLQAIRPAL